MFNKFTAIFLLVAAMGAFGAPPSDVAKPAEKGEQPRPGEPPVGALPPLVVSTDPAYDQYVSRLYVMSTVLPNGNNGIVYGPSAATWDEQLKAMQDFVVARAAWLDTQWQ